MAEGKITYLIVNVPPGTMKSRLIGVLWPAWVWTKRPDLRFLTGSNDQVLATRDAQYHRAVVRSDWYQARWGHRIVEDDEEEAWVQPDPDQDEKTLFATTKGGFRQSLGILSKVTGKRGDVLIIDDPHDTQQAESDLKRQAVLDKWDSSWSTRVNNLGKSPRVLVMQRQHANDLTGHLTKPGSPEPWVKLVIPMRYDPDNTYDAGRDIGRPDLNDPRKVEGELMFPEMFPEIAVEALAQRLGPYGASGQLQQRPSPKGGGEFRREWIMHYRQRPRGGNRYIIVDPAGEKNRRNSGGRRDNTAMGVFELGADQNYYLIDAYRDRLGLTERTSILFDWHRQYRPLGVGYESYGKDSDIVHIKDVMESQSYRFKITALGGTALQKEDRIRQLIPIFEANRMWLPETLYRTMFDGKTHDIIQMFIEQEYLPFPVAPFDDMIDMMARILDPDLKAVFPKAPRVSRQVIQLYKPKDPGAGY